MPRFPSVKAKVNRAVLIWARESAGMTQEQAARKIGKKFKVARIAAWESGDDRPAINQLRELSRIYKRPMAVFYLPKPPRSFPVPHDFRRLPDIGPPAYSPELFAEIRLAQERRQTALRLYAELEEAPPHFPLKATLEESIEAVAARAREAIGISIDEQVGWNDKYLALRKWRQALESLGILVFQVSRIKPTEMRGFSIADEVLPIMAVNRSNHESPRARVFSFMHELTHLMLRSSSVCDFDDESPRAAIDLQTEVFCNRVAAEILVPKAHFLSQSEIVAHPVRPREWLEETIAELSRRYGVSRLVIVRSLLTHGRANRAFYERKQTEYLARNREWIENQKPGFENFGEKRVRLLGNAFTRLVLETYHNGRLTLSEAVGHLGIKVNYLPTVEQALGTV